LLFIVKNIYLNTGYHKYSVFQFFQFLRQSFFIVSTRKKTTYQIWGLYELEGCPYVRVGAVQNVHYYTSSDPPEAVEICCPEKIK
jgi:hydrogenase-4 membrane subunit HyfE